MEFASESLRKARVPRTKDIVERIKIVTPRKIKLLNHPIEHPTAAFNPALAIYKDKAYLMPRVNFGYYTYTSSIALVKLDVPELLDKSVREFNAEIKIHPSIKEDAWGAEDPRATVVYGALAVTYTGRSSNYFDTGRWTYKTTPITAVEVDGELVKKIVFKTVCSDGVVSDKDAVLFEYNGKLYLLHRIRTLLNDYKAIASTVDASSLLNPGLRVVNVDSWVEVLKPASWESRIGWSTQPFEVDGELVVLVHSIDRDGIVYRVFAASIEPIENGVRVKAVTPTYIMEPRETYEVVGDRPLVVFPCGAVVVDDKIIVSYGATDLMIGIGVIDSSTLLSELDKNVVS